MTRLQYIAGGLTDGSAALARRIIGGACAWCRRGYRTDLTGWRAALGPAFRTVLLLAGLAEAGRLVIAHPAALWALTPVWSAAAWRTGQAATPAPAESPDNTVEDPPPVTEPALTKEEFSALVRKLAQGGAGAHLSALAEHLTDNPKETAAVRSLCAAHGVPVSPSVRQPGRGVSTGVKVKDLPPLSPDGPEAGRVVVVAAGQEPTTAPATATTTPTVEQHAGGAYAVIRAAASAP
ncbi:hypothetical protein I5Q34_32585 [Streptomyces sp. AV19]|uniref:hypothetical protein n=1 Tax=Streptomyces sp. AV19 TaxID=2793068 RepID=UPI0018FE7AA1|nr:hypothetical protein [Streptomyces sp. AV19]MBH1938944.1 hypothetical protein [Streptomyces sp. AV19]MDG4531629.1 hypothetical protein [Streptomyces sp. AV19]MDG4535310.1 hypothetical protein [Streptomyces sp. AV19]